MFIASMRMKSGPISSGGRHLGLMLERSDASIDFIKSSLSQIYLKVFVFTPSQNHVTSKVEVSRKVARMPALT